MNSALIDEYNKFETVLTVDVHTRDIVNILIRDGINEPHDLLANRILHLIVSI